MIRKLIISSAGLSALITIAASGAFMAVEPAIGQTATVASTTIVTQLITSEISFKTAPSNVSMSPSLGGLTGGTSNGKTQIVVLTSNTTGYNMTINAATSTGMIGNASSTNYISAYTLVGTTTPDFTFTVHPSQGAAFGYTVAASTTGDVTLPFKNNGTVCGAGSSANSGVGTQNCWIGATSTAYTIINTTQSTPSSGSTSTILYQVTINANPNPAIPNDTYTATTTLTATTNP